MIVIHNELHSNAAHPLIWINYDNVQAMPNIKGADIEVYLSCQQILSHVDRLVEAKSIQWSFDDYDYVRM